MRKICKKGALILAAALFIVAALSSCGLGAKASMSLACDGGALTVSSKIYGYYLSYVKTRMLYNYYHDMYAARGAQMPQDVTALADVPELWREYYSKPYTYGAIVKRQAESALGQMLAISAYCKDNGLELSAGELRGIDSAISDIVSQRYQNSRSKLGSKLKSFGINEQIYKEIKKLEAMAEVFGRDLFDPETGKRKITEDMINQLYGEICARVKHIVILYSPGTYDKDGKPEKYSQEELSAREAKAEDIYSRVTAGEDFENFLSESEDPGAANFPDGYTISESSDFVAEFVEAAFDMQIGEVRKVETSYGMHIMKRYDLLPAGEALDLGSQTTWRSVVLTEIKSYLMDNVLAPYIEKIEIDKDETKKFNVSNIAIMFDCMELW